MSEKSVSSVIVIFGASGDLTHRKLIPSLCNLYLKKRLPEDTLIVGFARRDFTNDKFRDSLRSGLERYGDEDVDAQTWNRFAKKITYFRGDLREEEDFRRLSSYLDELAHAHKNRLYYLAISPEYYAKVVSLLGEVGLSGRKRENRDIVIEKPFGRDLKSAIELNQIVHSVFNEDQVYRIDHYLGKETAQNILFFRFANTIFEPVWNREYISNIQITVAESLDIQRRVGYYEKTGVLRDIFQNHLVQLYTLVAMEPPASFEADLLRNEKVKVLNSTRPITLSETQLSQYEGYRGTPGVDPNSRTPTYAAMRLFLDNWRWQGVPFYLRSGKALERKSTEIVIEFQSPPVMMFDVSVDREFTSNILSICIQPDEGIHLRFEAKKPDSARETRSVDMEFHYSNSFGGSEIPDAYERLLLDALQRDPALFARNDEIELAWKLIDPIIEAWEKEDAPELTSYKAGTWGPKEADELLKRKQHSWLNGCCGH